MFSLSRRIVFSVTSTISSYCKNILPIFVFASLHFSMELQIFEVTASFVFSHMRLVNIIVSSQAQSIQHFISISLYFVTERSQILSDYQFQLFTLQTKIIYVQMRGSNCDFMAKIKAY